MVYFVYGHILEVSVASPAFFYLRNRHLLHRFEFKLAKARRDIEIRRGTYQRRPQEPQSQPQAETQSVSPSVETTSQSQSQATNASLSTQPMDDPSHDAAATPEYDFLVAKPVIETAVATQNMLLQGMSMDQVAAMRGLPHKSVEIHALEGLRRYADYRAD